VKSDAADEGVGKGVRRLKKEKKALKVLAPFV